MLFGKQHSFQTQLEQALGIKSGLKKRCYVCFIDENEKSTNATTNATTSVATLHPLVSDLSQILSLLYLPNSGTLETIADKGGGSNLRMQTGFIKNSVVLCPQLFLYHHSISKMEAMNAHKEEFGPFAHGKIVQVPDEKNNVAEFIVRHDESKDAFFLTVKE